MKCFITCPVQAAINQMGFSVPGLSSDWKHQPSTSGAAPLNISILLQIYTENKQTNKPTRTFQLRPQLTSKLLQKANSNKSWPLNIQGTPTQPARPRTPVLGALLTAEGRFLAPSSALGGHSYTQLWPAGEHCIPMCITSLFPSLFGFLSPQLHFFFFFHLKISSLCRFCLPFPTWPWFPQLQVLPNLWACMMTTVCCPFWPLQICLH